MWCFWTRSIMSFLCALYSIYSAESMQLMDSRDVECVALTNSLSSQEEQVGHTYKFERYSERADSIIRTTVHYERPVLSCVLREESFQHSMVSLTQSSDPLLLKKVSWQRRGFFPCEVDFVQRFDQQPYPLSVEVFVKMWVDGGVRNLAYKIGIIEDGPLGKKSLVCQSDGLSVLVLAEDVQDFILLFGAESLWNVVCRDGTQLPLRWQIDQTALRAVLGSKVIPMTVLDGDERAYSSLPLDALDLPGFEFEALWAQDDSIAPPLLSAVYCSRGSNDRACIVFANDGTLCIGQSSPVVSGEIHVSFYNCTFLNVRYIASKRQRPNFDVCCNVYPQYADFELTDTVTSSRAVFRIQDESLSDVKSYSVAYDVDCIAWWGWMNANDAYVLKFNLNGRAQILVKRGVYLQEYCNFLMRRLATTYGGSVKCLRDPVYTYVKGLSI